MLRLSHCLIILLVSVLSACGGGSGSATKDSGVNDVSVNDSLTTLDDSVGTNDSGSVDDGTGTSNDGSHRYKLPSNTTLNVGRSYIIDASIDWNNSDESTEKVTWSGSGTEFLNDVNSLTPTFDGRKIGSYTLTQQILSTLGKTLETKINIVVYDENIQAARFLQQATFGPSLSTIEDVKRLGYEGWLDAQIALPATLHLPILEQKRNEKWRWQAWSIQSTYAPDQLRQRMGFAFSEIMTVSFKAITELYNQQAGMTHYYDSLVQHSLGNYRELLEVVTRHAVMGIYLTYIGNTAGERPDENYAREIMQLFSIGLVELNLDGTPKLDEDGNTIPTYTQTTIEQFAKIFTGLCYAKPMNNKYCNRFAEEGTFNLPMTYWEDAHDQGEKQLLNGLVVPANQGGNKDLADALDNLADHPNTAPFISTLLIKRMVTSNPSPQYVERVANQFVASQGNLAVVAKAILLDEEARNGQHSNSFGKLREPLLKMTHLFRALEAHMPNVDQYRFGDGNAFYDLFGQAPFYSPSVFNFFMPDYTQGEIKKKTLVAPEFQILSASQLLVTENKFFEFIFNPAVHYPNIHLDLLSETYQENGIDALIERLNVLFTSGLMSESMKETMKKQVDHMIEQQTGTSDIVKNILLFVMQSPEFSIQR